MDTRIATLLLSGLAGVAVAIAAGSAAFVGWVWVGALTAVIAPCAMRGDRLR